MCWQRVLPFAIFEIGLTLGSVMSLFKEFVLGVFSRLVGRMRMGDAK